MDSKDNLAIIVSLVDAAMGKEDRMDETVNAGVGEDAGDGDVADRMCLEIGVIGLMGLSKGYGSGLDGGGKYDN
jgi:hypothetical protein